GIRLAGVLGRQQQQAAQSFGGRAVGDALKLGVPLILGMPDHGDGQRTRLRWFGAQLHSTGEPALRVVRVQTQPDLTGQSVRGAHGRDPHLGCPVITAGCRAAHRFTSPVHTGPRRTTARARPWWSGASPQYSIASNLPGDQCRSASTTDRKSARLNSSRVSFSYTVFFVLCLILIGV